MYIYIYISMYIYKYIRIYLFIFRAGNLVQKFSNNKLMVRPLFIRQSSSRSKARSN